MSAAAYLAGALVFRTMSGSFPSEIGGVKFVADAGTGLEKVEANIEAVRTKVAAVEARMETSDREVENIRRVATDGVAAVTKFEERLDDALDGIDQLAEAIVALGDELRDLKDRRQ